MNLIAASQILAGISSLLGAAGTLRRREWLKSIPYLIGIATFLLFLFKTFHDRKQEAR